MSELKIENFLKVLKERKEKIKNAREEKKTHLLQGNILSKKLHPQVQKARIKEINFASPDMKSVVFEKIGEDKKFAPFRAGQYVSIAYEINNVKTRRPYSICSSPSDREKLEVCIRKVENGLTSNFVFDNWKVGDEVELSSPQGFFYPERIRDKYNLIGIAGGSGITPFVSIARAICDGKIDFELTLFDGARKKENIAYYSELEDIVSKTNKVKVIYVLSEEKINGFENGFIDNNIIDKYIDKEISYTYFICGPQAMYGFIKDELSKKNLDSNLLRYEVSGERITINSYKEFDKELKDSVKITVHVLDEVYHIDADPKLTILRNLENNGIACANSCRSGECGLCHSYLLKGEVFTPKDNNHLRKADEIYNQIHICSCFALNDIEIQIPKV